MPPQRPSIQAKAPDAFAHPRDPARAPAFANEPAGSAAPPAPYNACNVIVFSSTMIKASRSIIANKRKPSPISSHVERGQRRNKTSSPRPKKSAIGRITHRITAPGRNRSWSIQDSLEGFATTNCGFILNSSRSISYFQPYIEGYRTEQPRMQFLRAEEAELSIVRRAAVSHAPSP
jgi:hypothetical protein